MIFNVFVLRIALGVLGAILGGIGAVLGGLGSVLGDLGASFLLIFICLFFKLFSMFRFLNRFWWSWGVLGRSPAVLGQSAWGASG